MQKLWSVLFAAVILAEVILVLVTPAAGWGLPKDVSSYGFEVDNLFHLILVITGIVFLLTEGLLVYYMYRYASEPGRKAIYADPDFRAQSKERAGNGGKIGDRWERTTISCPC